MTKTYSEQRQAILFKAARDFRAVGARVLDDVQNPVELRSEATIMWAASLYKQIGQEADALEEQGHEYTIATPVAEKWLVRSKRVFNDAHTNFKARIERARQ